MRRNATVTAAADAAEYNLASLSQGWLRPEEVKVEGDRLVWRYGRPVPVSWKPALLEQFLNLARPAATPKDIERIAKRAGVFQLCEHGWPASHGALPPLGPSGGHPGGCLPLGWTDDGPWNAWEPTARWFAIAREAQALYRLGQAVHNGRQGALHDWRVFYAHPERWRRDVDARRSLVAEVMNQWLAFGDVRPRMRWFETAPRVEFGGGLFGALTVALLGAISQTREFAICAGCDRLYMPGKRASATRRNFCDDCRERSPDPGAKQRMRDYRARRAADAKGRRSGR